MMINENFTSKSEYERLSSQQNLSTKDVYKLARYPYVSLVDMCGNVNNIEFRKIKEIEDLNIFYFLNILKIVCGLGSPEETKIFNQALLEEPLRTAVIIAKAQADNTEKYISFITNAIRILLCQPPKEKDLFRDPINIGIVGKLPRDFLRSRQEIGNNWYNNFVEIKLNVISHICRSIGETEILPIMLMSTAFSLYKFSPNRYQVSDYRSLDDNLHIILDVFFETINKIKQKQ